MTCTRRSQQSRCTRPPAATLAAQATIEQTLLALLACPNIASRRPLFEQYDAIVQSRTVRRPEQADAAVLALADGSALAVSIDCNGRRVAADPYRGSVETVLECAANLACVGAEPLGTTNNLNFGNPEKPHIAWQLSEAVRGLGDACRALQAPIVGGNVSLYNEGATGPIYPTPVIGMVGRLPDARLAGRLGFPHAGERDRAGRAVRSVACRERAGEAARRAAARRVGRGRRRRGARAHIAVREAVRASALSSAHDIAEGGLAIALAECCLAGGIGAKVELGELSARAMEALFGEGPGGFVVSGPAVALNELAQDVPLHRLGTVGGGSLELGLGAGGRGAHDRPVRSPSCRGVRQTHASLTQESCSREPPTPPASVWLVMREGPRDECGVFGLYAPGHEVSRLSYFALYALQHRGQESAGIAAADRDGHIITRRELGLVNQVFTENDLRTLAGELAIGHVRYSTTGSNAWENSQPVQRSEGTNGSRRELALAHNGNLINAVELHNEMLEAGVTFSSTSDSEIIAALIATHPAEHGRGRDRRGDAAPARRLLDGRDDEGPRGRLPRPARAAPAVDRRASR